MYFKFLLFILFSTKITILSTPLNFYQTLYITEKESFDRLSANEKHNLVCTKIGKIFGKERCSYLEALYLLNQKLSILMKNQEKDLTLITHYLSLSLALSAVIDEDGCDVYHLDIPLRFEELRNKCIIIPQPFFEQIAPKHLLWIINETDLLK